MTTKYRVRTGRSAVRTVRLNSVCACAIVLLGVVATTKAQQRQSTLFENVTVITMTSNSLLPARDVLIVDGTIADIQAHPAVLNVEPGQRIDGKNKFLMPGLIDSHIHIWQDAPARINDRHAARRLLVHGITRARVAFGEAEILPWRDAIEAGDEAGARLLVASPYITTSVETEDFILSNPGPEEARTAIQGFANAGYDYVKVVSVADPMTLDAILESAYEHELPVLGHFPNPEFSVASVVKSSWRSVEHFDILAELLRKQLGDAYDIGAIAAYFNSADAAITTVGLLFEDEIDARSVIGTDLRDFVAAGGTLLAGTEGNFGPGGLGNTLHLELEKLVAIGLTPYEALKTATINGGLFAAKDDRTGALAVDYAADLILINRNPLQDIGALRSLEGVMVMGHWYDAAEIKHISSQLPPLAENE